VLGEQALTGAPAEVAVADGVEILGAERGVGERRLVASPLVRIWLAATSEW
jgi:hypothetical protein